MALRKTEGERKRACGATQGGFTSEKKSVPKVMFNKGGRGQPTVTRKGRKGAELGQFRIVHGNIEIRQRGRSSFGGGKIPGMSISMRS